MLVTLVTRLCVTVTNVSLRDMPRHARHALVTVSHGLANLWSGMESCFGKVCAGDVYIPQNANQNCDKSVNVCIQDITIGSLAGSNMSAACILIDG